MLKASNLFNNAEVKIGVNSSRSIIRSLCDIFGVPPLTSDNNRANGLIKLGVSKLPLIKLVEGDFSFQA